MNNKIKIAAAATTASLLLSGCGSELRGSAAVSYPLSTEEDVQKSQSGAETPTILMGDVAMDYQASTATDGFVNVDPIIPENAENNDLDTETPTAATEE